MKLNKNLSLLLVLIILSTLAWVYQGPLQKWRLETSQPKNPFKALNFNDVDKISISKSGKTTDLVKSGDNWKISGGGQFLTSKQLSEQIVDTINKAKSARLDILSTKKTRQAELGLANEATQVKFLKDKDEKLKIKLAAATDYTSSLVAFEGDDATYKISVSDLFNLFNQAEWRDLSIFSLAGKSPNYLRLQMSGREIKLTPKDKDWVDGKSLYTGASVKSITDSLLTLSAVSIPSQDFKIAGLEKPTVIVQFKGVDFDKTLMIGKKHDTNYFAKTSDSDNLYLISQSIVDQILTGLKKK
ncbi:MAG: DUF4340 domain-containing protein [bacterium]